MAFLWRSVFGGGDATIDADDDRTVCGASHMPTVYELPSTPQAIAELFVSIYADIDNCKNVAYCRHFPHNIEHVSLFITLVNDFLAAYRTSQLKEASSSSSSADDLWHALRPAHIAALQGSIDALCIVHAGAICAGFTALNLHSDEETWRATKNLRLVISSMCRNMLAPLLPMIVIAEVEADAAPAAADAAIV